MWPTNMAGHHCSKLTTLDQSPVPVGKLASRADNTNLNNEATQRASRFEQLLITYYLEHKHFSCCNVLFLYPRLTFIAAV